MKQLVHTKLIATLICVVHIQFSRQNNYKYEVKYLDVPIDHFSFVSNATFKLRYLVNDTHWNSDAPIFFYTGNEANIEVFAENTGFMWEIAAEFRALLVFAEHRYYGESLPFGNKSFSGPQWVGFLSSTQALADYVYLIEYLQKDKAPKDRNPVIAFGGSYGGMLSAWLRMKYPASVLGAIAASAPVLQFQGLAPCGIFNRIVTAVFKISSPHNNCPHIISKSWAAIRELAATADGKSWLSSNWKLCKPLQTDSDIEELVSWLTNIYGNLAMINYPYSTTFLAPVPPHPVKNFCNKLQDASLQPRQMLTKLGNALSVYTNYTGNVKCLDISESSSKISDLGWDFQSCTEIIMPMCSTKDDMFEDSPWNFTKYSEACYSTWKVLVTRSDLAIMEYGGKDLTAASNIVFSNGLLDPWSGGGVLNNVSQTVLAVVIPEGAHHLDLRASNPVDPHSVIAARRFHKRAIYGWLKDYYRDNSNLYYL